MKKRILILACLCCILTLTGCGSNLTLGAYSQDIEKMELVQTIGVDRDGGSVQITAAVKQAEEQGIEDAGNEGGSPLVLSAESASVVGALERLSNYSAKGYLFLAHTRHYVLGEVTAQNGIAEYLDFIERDMNMRLNTTMFIVKGAAATEVMEATGEDGGDISQMLENIQQSVSLLSDGYVFSCGEVATDLVETGSALVAAIQMIDAEDSVAGEGAVMVVPAGYAVVKDGKLVDYIDTDDAAGANIFLGNTDPDIIQLEDENGDIVALRVAVADSSFTPVFEDGEIVRIQAKVSLRASIDEVGGNTDIYDDYVLDAMAEKVSAYIKEKGAGIITLSQELQADFLNIGKKVNIQAPVKFANMQSSWSNVFSELDIDLSVETQIERTYDLMQPVGVSGDEQ